MAGEHPRILFTGPAGAGKTSAIAALSDVPPQAADAAASGLAPGRNGSAGVTVDYGVLQLADGRAIDLFGTPDQQRLDYAREVPVEGTLGVVLLLDASRPTPHKDMLFFIETFKRLVTHTALAIGVTRTDLAPEFILDDLYAHLDPLGLGVPVFEVDARSREDVATLVRGLLFSLDPELDERVAA